ncbi:MAG: hypothetical protein HYW91_00480 [Candidatus Sungbacteria bacterium]|nr:hypothetical protein [Candidatus Sungbacteria bacterium]
MSISFKEFCKELWADYAKRFWIFWTILYVATVSVELSRQVLLESLDSLKYLDYSQAIFGSALQQEFLSSPALFLPLGAIILLHLWGFASLYLSFGGTSLRQSFVAGLKKLPVYLGYIIVASVLTFAGFLVFTAPLLMLASSYFPGLIADNLFLIPLALIFGLPGIYLLVAFANGPFILLLEGKSILKSLRESVRRIHPHWFLIAGYLLISFAVAGAAYYILMRLVFTIKLNLLTDLSLRGESMLRIFLYSIPWVMVASFYDLAVYHLYRLLAWKDLRALGKEEITERVVNDSRGLNFFNMSPAFLKITSVFILIAFVSSFAFFPIPVQAGGGAVFGTVFSIIATAAFCAVTYGVGCITAAAGALGGALMVSWTAVAIVSLAIVGIPLLANQAGTALFSLTCDGNYDYIFGTCTKEKTESQEIRTSRDVKFVKITYAGVPTPEEFLQNPSSLVKTTIRWKGDAPQGVAESVEIKDKTTGQKYPVISGTAGIACTRGEYEATYSLPYEKEFIGEINYATCIQIAGGRRRREYRPVCSGCGSPGNLVKTEFTTPSLPLPKVDIKADGKDGGLVFRTGTPIKLSWASEYALSCTAEGSWNGNKITSGEETVIPQTGNEVYSIVCKRGDKTSRDSVSSAPAAREIRIFGTSESSGGSIGNLHISSFNITNPLNPGDTITISWSAQNAQSCEVDNGIGNIPTSGSVNIIFLKTVTFTLTCTDENHNSVSAQKTVEVRRPPGFKEIKPE